MIQATRAMEAERDSEGQPERSSLRFVAKTHNKAHTATAHRVARKLHTDYNEGPGFDIDTGEVIVEIETTASLPGALTRLERESRRAFVAMTNKEGVIEALHQTVGSRVGVMDPYGNVIRESVA